eukprot:gene6637-7385_t
MRRVAYYNLTNLQEYSKLLDEELDSVIIRYISNHGRTTGETYVRGHLRPIGCNVQIWSVRESIKRVDPKNSALRQSAMMVDFGPQEFGSTLGLKISRFVMLWLQSGALAETVTLPVHLQEINTLKGCGGMSSNLWLNGMMNEHNPLAGNNGDDPVTDEELFGEDPQGPSPFEQLENNVIVSQVEIPGINIHNLSIDINSQIDVLRESSQMGIDIHLETLDIIERHLQQLKSDNDI